MSQQATEYVLTSTNQQTIMKNQTKTPQLTIAIIHYNSRGVILDCITSIYATITAPFELIIVDNNSHDDTLTKVKQQFPDARIIYNNTNRGYGPACNQAIAVAKGKHILILNQDIVLENNTVNELLRYLSSNNDARIVACKLKNKDGTTQDSFRTFPTLFSLIKRQITTRLGLKTVVNNAHTPFKVDWVSGALMLLRDKYYFNEQFFFYFEDVDLCKRIGGVYYCSQVSAHHAATRASANNLAKALTHARGALKYFLKHGFF